MSTEINPIESVVERAHQAVAAVTSLDLGAPYGRLETVAREAIGSLADECASRLFPAAIRPFGTDVYADFDFHLGDVPAQDYGGELAAILGRALDGGYQTLADLIATPEVRSRVARVAESRAGVKGMDPAAHVSERIRRFERLVAQAFYAHNLREPFAGHLALTVPTLERELAQAVERQRSHSASALAQQEREAREAQSIIDAEHKRRLEGLVTFFLQHRGASFSLNGAAVPGSRIAHHLKAGANPSYIDAVERLAGQVRDTTAVTV